MHRDHQLPAVGAESGADDSSGDFILLEFKVVDPMSIKPGDRTEARSCPEAASITET